MKLKLGEKSRQPDQDHSTLAVSLRSKARSDLKAHVLTTKPFCLPITNTGCLWKDVPCLFCFYISLANSEVERTSCVFACPLECMHVPSYPFLQLRSPRSNSLLQFILSKLNYQETSYTYTYFKRLMCEIS